MKNWYGRYGWLMLLVCCLSCRNQVPVHPEDVLVQVGGQTLRRTDVVSLIPATLSSSDSLLMAESYVKKWVKDQLVYDVATRNLESEKADIDQLVEAYRRSLVSYRYQERLVKEKLASEISEADMRQYYEGNVDEFRLDQALIKGVFLKVPVDAPGLADLKQWCKSTNPEAIEKIEKYSLQNAVIYDYFYDRWLDAGSVVENMPRQSSASRASLNANTLVEVSDSAYCYLLAVKDYIPAGKTAPYEYVEPQIKDQLLAQRKIEFLKNFEDELYNEAIRSGEVKFYAEEP